MDTEPPPFDRAQWLADLADLDRQQTYMATHRRLFQALYPEQHVAVHKGMELLVAVEADLLDLCRAIERQGLRPHGDVWMEFVRDPHKVYWHV